MHRRFWNKIENVDALAALENFITTLGSDIRLPIHNGKNASQLMKYVSALKELCYASRYLCELFNKR